MAPGAPLPFHYTAHILQCSSTGALPQPSRSGCSRQVLHTTQGWLVPTAGGAQVEGEPTAGDKASTFPESDS